ncbi:MAG: lipid-A-disaccharide synthase [Gammaproteobacteria bacterium]|nr:lipid-A-disaccharide synthase [Gammaproteobacteria bacterium]
MQHKNIFIVAGEASGEQHGAALVRAFQQQGCPATFTGIGGQAMQAAGVNTVVDVKQLSVMGFIDVIKHLPTIIKIFCRIKKILRKNRPDLLILIDYPGFNLRLANVAKKLGIKVLFYISPQVWAWRQGRVKYIAKVVDRMAVIFPFEVAFYKHADIPVDYVGHPLINQVKTTMDLSTAKQQFNLKNNHHIIGLLPGSRNSEIKRLLPTILEAARLIHLEKSNTQFLIPLASTIDRQLIMSYLQRYQLDIQIISGKNYDVMNVCDALITSSGTATLEAALMTKPMVLIYKISTFAAIIMKFLLKIPHVGLCNIIAEKKIVLELLQQYATPQRISQEISHIINNKSYRQTMIAELNKVKEKLGNKDGSQYTAQIIKEMLVKG